MEPLNAHPVLSLDDAKRFEASLFTGDETKEWTAMSRAGAAIAAAVLADFCELGACPRQARLLVLVGKGHNGGDALLAAKFILQRHPEARAELVLAFAERSMRPLCLRAYRELGHAAPGRVGVKADFSGDFDLCLDGVFGFQFRPPVEPRVRALFVRVNAASIRFRAAVDLPSALGTPEVVRADFTYATGIVKAPVLVEENAAAVGRLRYLDLGFFEVGRVVPNAPSASPANGGDYDFSVDRKGLLEGDAPSAPPASNTALTAHRPPISEMAPSAHTDLVLTRELLAPLRALRAPASDKRAYGHLFVIGGSRSYPGAVLMSVLAALRSGVGLLTALVPESLAPAFAARVPEAMWVGWPETREGGLALEGTHLLRDRLARATALVIGPGLSREPETLAFVSELVKTTVLPLVLDADALQPEIVSAGKAPRILTPHAGEFARIAGGKNLREFSASRPGVVTVLKGPRTRLCAGGAVHHALFGGPVLARGGSGDLLAGMIGGILAGNAKDLLASAARGVVWHGLAADALARAHGQTAVRTTQLLDFLPEVLRSAEV